MNHADLITQILREALLLTEQERPAFLRERCGEDATMCETIEALIENQASQTLVPELDQVVTKSPTRSDDGPPQTTPWPRRIASYEVRGILGEGGMGTVYLAEQQRPKRLVALKVIRAGANSAKLLQRFEHEAEILARLQHPGIAQVHESGATEIDGTRVPYIVMEYVEGLPLMDWVRRNDLDENDVLHLMNEICQAVQHAHQKGVIHRDLKPANILVTPDGRPRILDFGVARATDADLQTATLHTDAGQLVGTVPYMSPEQIDADPEALDTRSDIYTLGVILYEMLTGRLPYPVKNNRIAEAARLITECVPEPLTVDGHRLDDDLDTMVGKALEKEPDRRYQSAAEFAADIQRYRTSEPILARPPSVTYQLRKFVGRNRALTGAIASAVLILIMGIASVLWFAIDATEGRRVAELERDKANAINQFLNDMLSSVDPELSLGRDVTVREILDVASDSLDSSFEAHPEVRDAVRKTVTMTYINIGSMDRAETHARKLAAAFEEEYGPANVRTLEAKRLIMVALTNRGAYADARAMGEAILPVAADVLGSDHELTLVIRSEFARILHETGNMEEARDIWQALLPVLDETLGPEHKESLSVRHNLGTSYKDLGRFEDAEALIRETLRLRRNAFGPEHLQTAYSLNALAALLQKLGRNDEALDMFRSVHRIRQRSLGDEHPATVTALTNLGVTMVSMGNLDEAEPLLVRAVEGYRNALGPANGRTLNAMNSLAYLYEDLGRPGEAEALYRQTLDLQRRSDGGLDPENWAVLNNLAMLLLTDDRAADAEPLFTELLDMCRSTLPEGHYYTAIFETNYALCLIDLQRYDDAQDLLLSALPRLSEALGDTHQRTLTTIERLVTAFEMDGENATANEWRARLASVSE